MKKYKRFKGVNNDKEFFRRPSKTSASLVEAVYRPDKYVNILYSQFKNIIKANSGRKFKYNEKLVIYLSEQFKEFNIVFDYSGHSYNDGKESGINGMTSGSNSLQILIYCSPSIEKLFIDRNFQKLFLKAFKELIGHELIHRSQYIAVKNYHNQNNITRFLTSPKYKTEIGYYADKSELMSYAWQIIEELRFLGAYDFDILDYIRDIKKHPEYKCLVYEEIYLKYYKNTQIINRLIKYIYEYLKGNLDINDVGIK